MCVSSATSASGSVDLSFVLAMESVKLLKACFCHSGDESAGWSV
jgi:hypothetical protein